MDRAASDTACIEDSLKPQRKTPRSLHFPQPSGVCGPLRSSIEELRFAARKHLLQRQILALAKQFRSDERKRVQSGRCGPNCNNYETADKFP